MTSYEAIRLQEIEIERVQAEEDDRRKRFLESCQLKKYKKRKPLICYFAEVN